MPICDDQRAKLLHGTIAVLAAAVLALSCRSPVGHHHGKEKSGYTFSFIVSGVSSGSRSADGRLILPTATELAVSVRRNGYSSDKQNRTVSIATGSSTVPVSFDDLETGTYTVTANAYADPASILFTQTATVDLSPDTETVTLNLVPTNPEALAADSANALDIPELASGTAKTWHIAAGARMLAARSLFLSGLNTDARVFLQSENGTLIVSCRPNRLSLGSLDSGASYYLTVYAGASAQSASRAFPGPVMLPVPAGSFQRDSNGSRIFPA